MSALFICGFIGCDARPFNALLATLPRLLRLPAERAGDWATRLAQLAVAETAARRPGREALLERLREMMFVHAIRRHVEGLPEDSTGWLARLRDRFVGRALALLHAEPGAAWTLDVLAGRVGLSRSALAQRFTAMVGQSPMEYLAPGRRRGPSATSARGLNRSPGTAAWTPDQFPPSIPGQYVRDAAARARCGKQTPDKKTPSCRVPTVMKASASAAMST